MSVQCGRKHITQLSSEQIAKEIQLIYKFIHVTKWSGSIYSYLAKATVLVYLSYQI